MLQQYPKAGLGQVYHWIWTYFWRIEERNTSVIFVHLTHINTIHPLGVKSAHTHTYGIKTLYLFTLAFSL